MNNDKIMIFCTASSNNKEYYLKRIQQWYNYLKQILNQYNIDFYAISDGTISLNDQKYIHLFNNINFINLQPLLGIRTNNFLGWRRSIVTALEIGRQYKYIVHIQSDLKILNIEKFKKYLLSEQMYVGYENFYKFIETALMILNNKDKNQKIIQVFKHQLYISETIQPFVQNLTNPIIMFNGIRYEGHNERLNKDYDYIGQLENFQLI